MCAAAPDLRWRCTEIMSTDAKNRRFMDDYAMDDNAKAKTTLSSAKMQSWDCNNILGVNPHRTTTTSSATLWSQYLASKCRRGLIMRLCSNGGAVPATVIKPDVDLQHVENSRLVRPLRCLPAPSYGTSSVTIECCRPPVVTRKTHTNVIIIDY